MRRRAEAFCCVVNWKIRNAASVTSPTMPKTALLTNGRRRKKLLKPASA